MVKKMYGALRFNSTELKKSLKFWEKGNNDNKKGLSLSIQAFKQLSKKLAQYIDLTCFPMFLII